MATPSPVSPKITIIEQSDKHVLIQWGQAEIVISTQFNAETGEWDSIYGDIWAGFGNQVRYLDQTYKGSLPFLILKQPTEESK